MPSGPAEPTEEGPTEEGPTEEGPTEDEIDDSSALGGACFQHIVIKGVQRFAEFEHGVVGRIDDVIDRAHAREFESALNLIRAGFDLHIADQACHETRIKFRVADLDFN